MARKHEYPLEIRKGERIRTRGDVHLIHIQKRKYKARLGVDSSITHFRKCGKVLTYRR